jgi:hypothetical protein
MRILHYAFLSLRNSVNFPLLLSCPLPIPQSNLKEQQKPHAENMSSMNTKKNL